MNKSTITFLLVLLSILIWFGLGIFEIVNGVVFYTGFFAFSYGWFLAKHEFANSLGGEE